MEGRSLVPALNDQPVQREAIYWEHEGNRAIRVGDWKAVAKGPSAADKPPGDWELYDLSVDRTEQHDLASMEKERLKQLVQMWQAYAERTQVLPSIVNGLGE